MLPQPHLLDSVCLLLDTRMTKHKDEHSQRANVLVYARQTGTFYTGRSWSISFHVPQLYRLRMDLPVAICVACWMQAQASKQHAYDLAIAGPEHPAVQSTCWLIVLGSHIFGALPVHCHVAHTFGTQVWLNVVSR